MSPTLVWTEEVGGGALPRGISRPALGRRGGEAVARLLAGALLVLLVGAFPLGGLSGTAASPSPSGEKERFSAHSAELAWAAERPLGWDDFWGRAPEPALRSNEAAKIWLVLAYEATWEVAYDAAHRTWSARLTQITARAWMDRARSWVLPEHATPALLRHEQGHFDLLEVFRRVLAGKLQGLVGVSVRAATREEAEKALGKLLAEVHTQVREAHEYWQAQYDRDTQNGGDPLRQREWEERIAQWLRRPWTVPLPP